ncbi:signal transduction histidine kinase [Leeuwenhoekiella aestuarii]|uniref:hybrid sensor histidine kinase/response regulator n=1 Tax=Leeuwenhoekiella aestuarii TaxID=2249426 RepID=UPI000FFEA063|nr:ATP-binding protein [Leeuwenhoekiella aestuarii]RXG12078.1 signal transduction histidine kinase [Leeuwenhoekiella aestuarii]
MKFIPKSFAIQIWISFVLFSGFLSLGLYLYLATSRDSEKLSKLTQKVRSLHNDFSSNFNNYQSFIISGYKQDTFYEINKQKDIDTFLSNLKSFKNGIQELRPEIRDVHLNNGLLDSLGVYNRQLIIATQQLRERFKERGFKDFGVEGTLREAAHSLEANSKISRAAVLQLRRHEKDYMLRRDSTYLRQFNILVGDLRNRHNLDLNTLAVLDTYQIKFNQYVFLSTQLGNYDSNGLVNQIRKQYLDEKNIILALFSTIDHKLNRLHKSNTQYLIIQTAIIILIAIILSLYLAKTLTYDIKLLNKNFDYFLNQDFATSNHNALSEPKFKLSSNEIRNLFMNFQRLEKKLNTTLKVLTTEKLKSENNAKYKARFLANMSHEIRTPLNGILGMMQTIEVDGLKVEQQENIKLANYSANHLLNLVNMILDYSKLEEGMMQMEEIPFDFSEIVINLKGLLAHLAKEKDIRLNFYIDDDIPKALIGDIMRLQQVLINLLSNAIKFTHSGNVDLIIDLRNLNDDYIEMSFKVKDTGIGINEKDQKRLFDAFVQNDSSTTRMYGGTGLGLTISYQLVALMGGELKLKSKPNQGSMFYFSLRLKQSKTHLLPVNSIKLIVDSFENKRILIAEDNKINRLVLEKFLRDQSFKYDTVSNGREAFKYFESDTIYDLILMDIHMPIMNGYRATEKIQNTEKFRNNPVPIIAISASAFEDDRKSALDVGMNSFIPKPIDFQVLKIQLEYYLSKNIFKQTSIN